MKKNFSFTLLGSNSGRNAGDAAILASILRLLKERFGPETTFDVPTTNTAFVNDNYGKEFNARGISVMPWTGSLRFLGLPTFRSVSRTDATLITDGIIFDVKLFNPLFNFLVTLIFIAPWAKFKGKKLICFNVGIGPLRSYFGRIFAKYVGSKCDLIICRDQDSVDLFREVGVTKQIYTMGDAVFAGWKCSEERTAEILAGAGINTAADENRLLGLNVTRYIDAWLSAQEKVTGGKEMFLDQLAEAIAKVIVNKNAQLVMFTTQVMDFDFADSLKERISTRIKQLSADADLKIAHLSNRDLSNHELMGVASKIRLFVGMRLHSLIISAQSGTPVVGLCYAPKVKSFLRQLQTPELAVDFFEF